MPNVVLQQLFSPRDLNSLTSIEQVWGALPSAPADINPIRNILSTLRYSRRRLSLPLFRPTF